jgi:hypothetical protein
MTTDIDAYVAELQRLLGRSAAADSVIREARGHLDDKVAALVRRGMTPAAAAREAVVAFGDVREFALAALASNSLDPAPPTFLRRCMLAGTVVTGLVAGVAFAGILLTLLFGGEESPVALALIGGAAAAILLHAVALGYVLLRRRQHWRFRSAVLLGGIGLLAVSGAAILGAELDDAPGGVLAGLLLAAQGASAVLAVSFPQLVPQRPLEARGLGA